MKRLKGKDEKQKSARNRKGLGRLRILFDVPVDIFCEVRNMPTHCALLDLFLIYQILERLYPLDLLNLARSSKTLHELIIARRMKSTWQASMNAQSVPPLPDNVPINEPQLASMLFDNSCQVCHSLSTSSER